MARTRFATVIVILAIALSLPMMVACSGQSSSQESSAGSSGASETASIASTSSEVIEPKEVDSATMAKIAGTWKARGAWYKAGDGVISLEDDKNLSDQYARHAITFNSDQTFTYQQRSSVVEGSWVYIGETSENLQGFILQYTSNDVIYYAFLQTTSSKDLLIVQEQGKDPDDLKLVMAKQDTSPSTSSGKSGSKSSASNSASSSSSGDLELMYEFEAPDGKGYQGSDGNYYFKNDDGSYEATDGMGTAIRDEDGDGEADMWTIDGGETWHRY